MRKAPHTKKNTFCKAPPPFTKLGCEPAATLKIHGGKYKISNIAKCHRLIGGAENAEGPPPEGAAASNIANAGLCLF